MKKLSKFLLALMAIVAVFATVGSTGLAVSAAEPDDEQLLKIRLEISWRKNLNFILKQWDI